LLLLLCVWSVTGRQLEYEIQTLRSVLAVKTREANELKRKLGITTMTEFREDFRHGVQAVRESDVYVSTASCRKKTVEEPLC